MAFVMPYVYPPPPGAEPAHPFPEFDQSRPADPYGTDNTPAMDIRYVNLAECETAWEAHRREEDDKIRDDELARILLYLGDLDIGDEHDHALNTAIERLKAKAHRGLTVPANYEGIPIVVTDLAPPDSITIIAKPE